MKKSILKVILKALFSVDLLALMGLIVIGCDNWYVPVFTGASAAIVLVVIWRLR
jgi:hypothetical protein